jgi:hypothetical protein
MRYWAQSSVDIKNCCRWDLGLRTQNSHQTTGTQLLKAAIAMNSSHS